MISEMVVVEVTIASPSVANVDRMIDWTMWRFVVGMELRVEEEDSLCFAESSFVED